MKKFSMFLLIFGVLSCNSLSNNSNIINSHDVVFKNGKAFSKSTNVLIEGKLIDYYDEYKISSEINYKNGVPDGEWILYGYDGEYIQKGFSFQDKKNTLFLNYTHIFHHEYSLFTEGEFEFFIISIWTNKLLSNSSLKEEFYNIWDLLKRNSCLKSKNFKNIYFNAYVFEKSINQRPYFESSINSDSELSR